MSESKSWFASVNWFGVIGRIGAVLAFGVQGVVIAVQHQDLSDLRAEQAALREQVSLLNELVHVHGERLAAVDDITKQLGRRLDAESRILSLHDEELTLARKVTSMLSQRISLVSKRVDLDAEAMREYVKFIHLDIGVLYDGVTLLLDQQLDPPS